MCWPAVVAGHSETQKFLDNMSAQMHRLYHLGSAKLSRSNLSRINEDKPYALYEALFGKLLTRCQGVAPDHDFRFNHPLYSLDASTIDLCLSVFPWADFRTTKGAIKLHVGLNHAGYLPEFVTITEGKKHDVTVGRTLNFPKGSIVAIDKAYNDYFGIDRANLSIERQRSVVAEMRFQCKGKLSNNFSYYYRLLS